MAAQPWFRKQDGCWYAYVRTRGRRRQVRLTVGAENRDEAFSKWHSLMAAGEAPAPQSVAGDAVATLLDRYLDHCQSNVSPRSYDLYRYFLQSFTEAIGGELTLGALKPFHVIDWLNAQTGWSNSTKNGAAQTIRTAFRWLTNAGYIAASPVSGVRGPSKGRREVVLTPEEFARLLAAVRDPAFRDLLVFLYHTGARPQEAIAVTAAHIDLKLRRIVFPPSQAKGKRHPRVIYLDDDAWNIVEQRCKRWASGPIFRNRCGTAWDRNSIRCRFRRLRDKLGMNLCAYHLRHSFATNALQKLDPITVSTLMGHADPSTLARTYQHLAKNPGYLLEAARKATA